MFYRQRIISNKIRRVVIQAKPLLVFGYFTPVVYSMNGKCQAVFCFRLNPRTRECRCPIFLVEMGEVLHLFRAGERHLENLWRIKIFGNEIAVALFFGPWFMSVENRNANNLTLILVGKVSDYFALVNFW